VEAPSAPAAIPFTPTGAAVPAPALVPTPAPAPAGRRGLLQIFSSSRSAAAAPVVGASELLPPAATLGPPLANTAGPARRGRRGRLGPGARRLPPRPVGPPGRARCSAGAGGPLAVRRRHRRPDHGRLGRDLVASRAIGLQPAPSRTVSRPQEEAPAP